MNNLFVLVGLLTGVGSAVQTLVNAKLRLALDSPIWAAVAQTIVGLTLLTAMGLVTRQPAPVMVGWSKYPWWIWTGGIFGITYVVVTIIITPRLGTAFTLASIIVGQLTCALILDHYGWLGAPVVPLSGMRVLGAVLLVAGVMLIRR